MSRWIEKWEPEDPGAQTAMAAFIGCYVLSLGLTWWYYRRRRFLAARLPSLAQADA
jgi:hypothetical protein